MEEIEATREVFVPRADFKQYVKSHKAELKVVKGFYRWVAVDEEGPYVIRPEVQELDVD